MGQELLLRADGALVTRADGKAAARDPAYTVPAWLPTGNPDWTAVKNAIQATGVTLTGTQAAAGERLVNNLQGVADGSYATSNLWPKLMALYGLLGGTADAHKFNWKDPRDLDAARRLVYFGTPAPAHSASGVMFNTSNYCRTYVVPSADLPQNSAGLSAYSGTDVSGAQVLLGASNAGYANGIYLLPRSGSSNFSVVNETPSGAFGTVGNSLGLFTITRTGSTARANYQNAVQIAADATASVAPTTREIFLGANNTNGTPDVACSHSVRLAAIWSAGLTATEVTNLYNAVQAYQTALGRNV